MVDAGRASIWLDKALKGGDEDLKTDTWGFPWSWGYPIAQWFVRENPTKMDDLRVPPFLLNPAHHNYTIRTASHDPIWIPLDKTRRKCFCESYVKMLMMDSF